MGMRAEAPPPSKLDRGPSRSYLAVGISQLLWPAAASSGFRVWPRRFSKKYCDVLGLTHPQGGKWSIDSAAGLSIDASLFAITLSAIWDRITGLQPCLGPIVGLFFAALLFA